MNILLKRLDVEWGHCNVCTKFEFNNVSVCTKNKCFYRCGFLSYITYGRVHQ